ncbi:MAG: ABC transporter ATP-binding protein/permease [Chitinophagaceae bacterium]|jgi:ABC-type bacteriocin/lantibiotic exporter with double-glycine peptidase domain|nr:ABC transporter ATP-binding protein/permease [Chitinophagaceae bacterium]
MAGAISALPAKSPVGRILQVLKLDKREIWSVYFYSILNGLIQLSLPLGIQSIISFVLGGSISTSLVILIILVVTGVLIAGLLQVNQMKIIEKVQQKMFVRYAFEYAHRIPRLDLKSVDQYYLPELVNRFFDTVSLQKGISKLLLDIPTATIQIVFGLILLSFYHPVFIIFSLLLIAIVWAILYYSGSRGLATSLEESRFKYGVAGWLEELARVVRSFKFSKLTSLNLRRTDSLVSNYLGARTSHFKILLVQYWTLVGFKVLITAAMLIVGSVLLINQQLNLGQFIAAEIVILLVLNSVEKLIINLDKVYDVLTSVEKLSKVTDKPMDPDGDVDMPRTNKGMKIEAHNLGFSYDEKKVISEVSFEVLPGRKIAVMGADGSGKSTLLRVLSGVFNAYQGGLLADDIPLRNYLGDSFRQQTGILLQQQDIFQGTLLENITMGDEQIRPDDVMNLASRIGLSDFLQTQEQGFATMLDPVGKRLSRSVIQKILLLRALINHPRLLLLEEPWRGLETENRLKIQEYLIDGCPGATVFVESNDETFARRADEVMFFENGTLKYFGPWEGYKSSDLNY